MEQEPKTEDKPEKKSLVETLRAQGYDDTADEIERAREQMNQQKQSRKRKRKAQRRSRRRNR